MCPINVICETCGKDVLIEPEVEMDEEAECPECKGWLFFVEEDE
jgi:DNA-directed RNA polymerase subunit RPC12/RpoP